MRPYLVVGLGNPLLCDDTAGLWAVRRLQRSGGLEETDLVENHSGGLDLLDQLEGRRRVLVLDAVSTGSVPVGTCLELDLESLHGFGGDGAYASHGFTLPMLLGLGRRVGYAMPEELSVLAVEAGEVERFDEMPGPEVWRGVAELMDRTRERVSEWLRIDGGQRSGREAHCD